ncbi:MAG: primosomal protein N', partial [Myxococcales bacterium]|nr:primosomal protein N' [Myxococcales bacterium]
DVRRTRITEAGVAALNDPLAGLSTAEQRLLASLAEIAPRDLAVAKISSLRPRIASALKALAAVEERGLVTVSWDDGADEGSRTELHLRRTDFMRGSTADEEALRKLVGRSKQRRALLDFLETFSPGSWVSLGEIRGPFPRVRTLLPPLVEAGLVAAEERPRALDPFALGEVAATTPQAPTADQEAALQALRGLLDARRFATALLHGITGSGKTEVYLQVIAAAIEGGGGAIVLVPEIALTPQLSDRFRARFGDTVAVLHSALTPRQRLDAWQQIRAGVRRIVIGPRSAIFAPLPDLRVIVVDEEHDPSFKQEEGVRYHARDVALVRAQGRGALAILGSATPSLESFELARGGRYHLLELHTRPTPRPLPRVELVPLSAHRPDPETMLTARLRDALKETVEAGEQVILFLNRRGFATTLVCGSCGALLPCPDCSAPSMTYHLHRNRLMCHLCGRIEAPPERCPSCGEGEMTHGNPGTERIEVALTRELPGLRVLRLDRDTSRGRGLLDTLGRFRNHEADVLVGTQMLSKGHDFPGVTLVGILQADHGLGLPDLRAAERTFQLLTQVAGRAGRGDRPGRVLIQAYAINHQAIVSAAEHDYAGFAAWELARRRDLGNPPYGFLALLRISGLDADAVVKRAEALAEAIGERIAAVAAQHDELIPPIRALGPIPSPIERI